METVLPVSLELYHNTVIQYNPNNQEFKNQEKYSITNIFQQ